MMRHSARPALRHLSRAHEAAAERIPRGREPVAGPDHRGGYLSVPQPRPALEFPG